MYKNEVERSRKNVHAHFGQDGVFVPPTPNGVIAPATNHITVHYSFDFAQQVHYPSNPLQPGPIYFLTPRKAAIFGICCEAIPRQVNFIIDEASDTGKGANTVVSLVFSTTSLSIMALRVLFCLFESTQLPNLSRCLHRIHRRGFKIRLQESQRGEGI